MDTVFPQLPKQLGPQDGGTYPLVPYAALILSLG